MTKAREYHLRNKFGITPEQYDELVARSGGNCALCGKTPDENGQLLAIDHDHASGEIRGALCRYCNHRVIGRHRDPDLLRRMAEYLEKGKTGWFVPKRTRKRKTKAGGLRPRKVKNA